MMRLALALAMAACLGAAHARQSVLIVFDEDKDLPGLAIINRSLLQVRGHARISRLIDKLHILKSTRKAILIRTAVHTQ